MINLAQVSDTWKGASYFGEDIIKLTDIGIARFAAKEAVIKAHPQRNLTWHEITISHQASTHADRKGAPAAIIKGTNEDHEALISISHDGDYATAVCLGAQQGIQTGD